MYFLIGLIVLYFISIVLVAYCITNTTTSKMYKEENILGIFTFMYFAIAAIIWVSVCAFIQSTLPNSLQKTEQIEIYSLKDNLGVQGHFTMGCGYIESELYYFYYVDGELGYKLEKVKAKDVEIIELENENDVPSIITYQKLLDKPNNWFAFGKYMFDTTKTIVIEVPKGTIKVSYSIDLE